MGVRGGGGAGAEPGATGLRGGLSGPCKYTIQGAVWLRRYLFTIAGSHAYYTIGSSRTEDTWMGSMQITSMAAVRRDLKA